MRPSITFSIALALGLTVRAQAGPLPPTTDQHAVGLPSTNPTTNSGPQAPAAAATATPAENDSDTGDDSLYRASTKESLASGAMARDEGALHFKPRPKEKIKEVDSLKNLQSSGTDPKFQGSLAISGVPSIKNVANKEKQDANSGDEADDHGNADNADPRFTKKRLTFVPQKTDDWKKTESADSTPTPSPSPTASVAAGDSGASKK
jgi:hypothetical protein